MSIAVFSNPSRTFNTITSRTVAGLSQIRYEMQRQDQAVTSISGNPFLVLESGGSWDWTGLVEVGQAIYVYFEAEGINQRAIVTAVSTTQLTTNISYTAGAATTTGFVNFLDARKNYRIQFVLKDATGEMLTPQPFFYAPSPQGNVIIDLAQILRSYVFDQDAFTYGADYGELWEGNAGALMQLPQIQVLPARLTSFGSFGANMWEYLLKEEDELKRFLVDDSPGVIWRGWNFFNSFLIDLDALTRLTDTTVRARTRWLDVNKVEQLQEVADFNQFDTGQAKIEVGDTNVNYNNPSYKHVQFQVTNSADTINLTEALTFELRNPCKNPVMVEWLNDAGGRSQWLFGINQVIENEVSEAIEYQSAENKDWSLGSAELRRIIYRNNQTIQLFAEQLNREQLRALNEIKRSNLIYIWLDQAGTKKVPCRVSGSDPGRYETRLASQSFELALELPQDFFFYKAIVYDIDQSFEFEIGARDYSSEYSADYFSPNLVVI